MEILTKDVEQAFCNELEKTAFAKERAVTFVSGKVGKWLGAAQKAAPKFSGEIGALKGMWHSAMTPALSRHIPDAVAKQGVNVVGGIARKLKTAQSGTGVVGSVLSATKSGARKVSDVASVLNKPVSGTGDILSKFAPSAAEQARKSKTLSFGLSQLQKRRGY